MLFRKKTKIKIIKKSKGLNERIAMSYSIQTTMQNHLQLGKTVGGSVYGEILSYD